MAITTFTEDEIIKFCFMTEAEFNNEIATRVIEQQQLKNEEETLTTWGRKNTLKEEIDGLGRIKILIGYFKVKQNSAVAV